MHGLINRAIQSFVTDTYGREVWAVVTRRAKLDFIGFEAMLVYEDHLTGDLLLALSAELAKPRSLLLEDIGTYLVSHPNLEPLRRLLRFGGLTFVDFLHSLDDLPDRARLAVPDLELPEMRLTDKGGGRFSLICGPIYPGAGHVMVGVLTALADDYGALALVEHAGTGTQGERLDIELLEAAFAEGRDFDLGAQVTE